jgi:CBS domain-containing protein
MSKTQNRRDAPTSEFGEAYDSEVGEKKSLTNMVLDQLLSDVPQRDLLTVEPSTSITETVRRMNQRRLGYALIVEAGKLTGIFTERDVLTKVTGNDLGSAEVSTVMTRNPDTLPLHASIAFALQRMDLEGYRHIPLVDDDGCPLGLVAERDIVAWIVDQFPDSIMNLPPLPNYPSSVDGG